MTMEVSITVKRGKEATGKTYRLHEAGDSRKGTYKTFAPFGETPDLPGFGKVYIKADRDKEAAKDKPVNGKDKS